MAKSKKVNKWEAAPESIRKLKELIDKQRLSISLGECEDLIGLGALEKVLKEYNELEAKHNADCGLISKLEEENKAYETLAEELHNDTDELERTINDLEKMVEFHKGEVKELVKTADMVHDKHENEVSMLKKDVHDLEVKVKYYKEDIDDLECEVSKYKALYEGLVNQDEKIAGLKSRLERAESLLRFEANGKNMVLKKIETLGKELKEEQRKHEKATRFIARLTEALNDAGVDFHYVKIGDDGEWTFHIDSVIDKCAKKNYEAQIIGLKKELKSETDWANSYYDDLSELERTNAMLFESLDKAGIKAHYDDADDKWLIQCTDKNDNIRDLKSKIYKLNRDKGEIEHRDGLLFKALDRAGICPTFDNLNDKWLIQYTDRAENAFLAADQIKRDAEKKIDKLVSALDKCHLNAQWDHENDRWCIYVQHSTTEVTDVKFDLYEYVEGYEKLKNEIKDLKSDNRSLRVSYSALKRSREPLIGSKVELEKENEDLRSKNRSWQVSYNAMKKEAEMLTAERDRLNDYIEALKGQIQETKDENTYLNKISDVWMHNYIKSRDELHKALSNNDIDNKNLNGHIWALKDRIQELEDRSKDIYTLATIGWITDSMREYDMIRKILSFKPNTCTNCKNFDPKE